MKIVKIVLVSSVFVSQVFASTARTGIFLSTDAGYMNFSGTSNSIQYNNDSVSISLSGGAGASFLIGYQYALNPYIAIGIKTGAIYGAVAGETVTSSQTPSITMNATQVWYYPLLASFNLVTLSGIFLTADGGLSYNHANFTVIDTANIANTTIAENHNSTNPLASMSLGYQFNMGLSLYFKYTHVFNSLKKDTYQDLLTGNMYMLGVSYVFGD
ncbi:hypothetical protein [Facilibium subflavum]|uniref:hypothetical protein n=1 Tax=Facilibium subflavum TaxID=2219058 RepID=UPI000E6540FE|nr:hypothetical protein [Facilibium subflavum]